MFMKLFNDWFQIIFRKENGDIGGKTYNYDDDPDDEFNHPPILRLREDFTV